MLIQALSSLDADCTEHCCYLYFIQARSQLIPLLGVCDYKFWTTGSVNKKVIFRMAYIHISHLLVYKLILHVNTHNINIVEAYSWVHTMGIIGKIIIHPRIMQYMMTNNWWTLIHIHFMVHHLWHHTDSILLSPDDWL